MPFHVQCAPETSPVHACVFELLTCLYTWCCWLAVQYSRLCPSPPDMRALEYVGTHRNTKGTRACMVVCMHGCVHANCIQAYVQSATAADALCRAMKLFVRHSQLSWAAADGKTNSAFIP